MSAVSPFIRMRAPDRPSISQPSRPEASGLSYGRMRLMAEVSVQMLRGRNWSNFAPAC